MGRKRALRIAVLGGALAAFGCDNDESQTLFTNVSAVYLTVDDLNLYWSAHPMDGRAKQVPKTHLNTSASQDLQVGRGLAVIDHVVFSSSKSLAATSVLRCVPGSTQPLGTTFTGYSDDLVADASHIFIGVIGDQWTTKIWAQPTDGSPATLVADDPSGQSYGMALEGGELFWVSDRSRTMTAGQLGTGTALMKVSTSGGTREVIAEFPSPPATDIPGGPVANASAVFVAIPSDEADVPPSFQDIIRIDRASLEQTKMVTTGRVSGLAIDAQHLYWADRLAGTVNRLPLAADVGTAVVRVATAVDADRVALDDDYVYWSTVSPSSLTGVIARRSKASLP